uniref:nodulation protein NodH n=1 Tax=Yoonia sp. TaxID=2212373 RepID=UPI004048AF43
MAAFDYFVVFAEMRTGSNFLESNINAFDGLTCLGEAFNPHFIGYPQAGNVLGVTQKQRDADPNVLIEKIKAAEGVNGFRFFNDHDPRVLDICMSDRRCAKIILTRNPVESFVSWKIAAATGQWKLTNVSHAKTEKIEFHPQEFEAHLEALQAFQVQLLTTLQRMGQTAFYVAYEDLQDVEVMNGLAEYLGCHNRIAALDKTLKKQNPMPMSEKVVDFPAMEKSLARLDRFNLSRTPNFEPRRGPMIPSYVAAPKSGLLYMPVKSGPDAAVRDWLARLDGATADDLQTDFTQKALRHWKRSHVGHRSFSVVRHPLARAHYAFCHHILQTGEGCFREIRATLRKVHNLPIPEKAAAPETDKDYTMTAHRTAFLAWLSFLKSNLNAQTAIRVDGAWASQLTWLQGVSIFGLPDLILREDRMRGDFAVLASQLGLESMPEPMTVTDPFANRLAAIYDAEIESAARDACQRDYLAFGFGDWRPR